MSNEHSLDLQRRARLRIPGMTQLLSKRPDRFSLGVWPTYYERAKGARVWDVDGNEYLDMSIGGIGATVLGYADPEVDGAVCGAIAKGVASSLNCPEDVELAEVLCGLHPWADMVRFARTGGEAMTLAVRIARAATRRDVVAFCGYHGWHDWYLAANLGGENALSGHLMDGLNPAGVPAALAGTAHPFRYNHIDELKAIVAAHGKNLAAIVMEPIRSAQPEPGFLEGVRALASKTGAALIVDEISAGFRLCTGGAHLTLGLRPDMAVFSKALGNGYPIAAVIGQAKYMEAAQRAFISSTNWTERVGPTAALATIAKYRRLDVSAQLQRMGASVQQGLHKAAGRAGLPLHVDGMEAMTHFAFDHPHQLELKAYFIQLMLDRGFLASNLCYLMAAHTNEDVAAYLAACEESFALLAQALSAGDLATRLRGEPARAGFTRLA